MLKVELINWSVEPELLIEFAGRTAYQSQARISNDSAGKFVDMLVKLGHESVLEHAYATFRFSGVSRAMTHQLVRHRLVSYTQKSQRYVDEKGFDYVTPSTISRTGCAETIFKELMDTIGKTYKELRRVGIPKEDARFVLPNATETEIVVSANFRQWRHMIKLRTSQKAQWEIREVFIRVLGQLHQKCPNVFKDLIQEK